MSRAALISLLALGLSACASQAARSQPTAAGPATPAPNPATEVGPDASATEGETSNVVADAAPEAAAPPAPREPTTPMCKSYKQIVDAATTKFADLGDEVSLPGAERCTLVSGGPGHDATATFTCEFDTADDAVALAPKREALAEQLRACGATAAMSATRIRVVTVAGANHLVVNVHDGARWK